MALWLFALLAVCGPFRGLDSTFAARGPAGRYKDQESKDQRPGPDAPRPVATKTHIATHDQFPYHAAISPEIRRVPACSGALVAPQYVLTAASCVYGLRSVHVTLGSSNTFRDYPGQLKMWGHPMPFEDYDPEKAPKYQDIGLVRLPEAVLNNPHIRPIALVTKDMEDAPQGLQGNVTGWGHAYADDGGGYQPNLKYADVYNGNLTICKRTWPSWSFNTQLCLVGKNGAGVPCFVDPGAPFVANGHVYGVVSITPTSCDGYGAAYLTRVASYLPWIQEAMDYTGTIFATPQYAVRDLFRYHVAVSRNITRIPPCSGALVDPQYVVTTASCVYGTTRVRVTMGTHTTFTDQKDQMYMWGYAMTHEDYNPTAKKPTANDIGLIRLTVPLKGSWENPHIKPVPLAREPLDRTPTRLYGTLTGWSLGERSETNLKFAYFHLGDVNICQDKWPNWSHATQLCLVGENHTSVPCFAEPGAPFVAFGHLYGVLSVPPATCSSTSVEPASLTHVASYLYWLEEKMGRYIIRTTARV